MSDFYIAHSENCGPIFFYGPQKQCYNKMRLHLYIFKSEGQNMFYCNIYYETPWDVLSVHSS